MSVKEERVLAHNLTAFSIETNAFTDNATCGSRGFLALPGTSEVSLCTAGTT